MKFLKHALVLGAAVTAVSAQAQFGAATKADLSSEGGKQGLYGTYNPFARISAGGLTGNGYLASVEKALTSNQFGPNSVGVAFSRLEGANWYQFHYRTFLQEDAGVQLGIIGGDGYNGKNDFNVLYFKELPSMGETGIGATVFGGLYYDSADKRFNLNAAIKAAYPLQNGFSVDATLWYLTQRGDSGTFITLGVGYRF